MDKELIEEVRSYLLGSQNDKGDVESMIELSADDVCEIIIEAEIEECETCGIWDEIDALDEDGNCADCVDTHYWD